MNRLAPVEKQITYLLDTTNLSSEQIVETLRKENVTVDLNTVKRLNGDDESERCNYGSKLTPRRRRELIEILRNTTKPNLSSLAKQFGVSRGSIRCWWDKLSEVHNAINEVSPDGEFESNFYNMTKRVYNSAGSAIVDQQVGHNDYVNSDNTCQNSTIDLESDPLDLVMETNNSGDENDEKCVDNVEDLELVGPVLAKNPRGDYVRLPIVMYASRQNKTCSQTSLTHNISSSDEYGTIFSQSEEDYSSQQS